MTAVRDTPSSDGACVYEEIVKLYQADKKLWSGQKKVNGQTDGRTDRQRHTIIRPVFDGRIINYY
jgi:hypothetical protein